ncbi:transglutaminase-like domain-containing protein [Pseudomonas sp. RIT-PI-AD]|uniref:transglutaminase-like domain-containing protein n=1 Tax=Pseudomonas sp. RIT-PI-AD TaxID=3035294 RepID=UPI0021D7F0EA|nr:transglutaminase-like domain-containing protein [Pseudomonas sp. RIT-PI-AD]
MKRTFLSALVGGVFHAQGWFSRESVSTQPMLPRARSKAAAGRAYSPFLRKVSALLVLSIANMTCLPLAQALEYQRNQEVAVSPDAGERYGAFLSQLKDRLSAGGNPSVRQLGSQKHEGPGDVESLDRLQQDMEAEWKQLKATWREAGVASAVFDEQERLEVRFREQHRALRDRLKAANTASGKAELKRFAQEQIAEPTHLPVDLNNLPWQVEQNRVRAPLTDAAALNRLLTEANGRADVQKATAENSINTVPMPMAKNAIPGELAQTLDAPHTEAIKALAVQLGKNPHTIYQWVHDNIRFFPSYGSVQGAQDTLDKKSGNAFDQASLLIALLRSAGVPARYVYGTVDIPAEQVMNWVGGVKNAEAAQQILGQGGIPNIGVTSGGRIALIRMEHVWVEAYVQYQPHRGAKHIGGQNQGDTWVPMDASFKQYDFVPGVDLDKAITFDGNSFAQVVRNGAVVNEQEGWVQNLDYPAIKAELKAYQRQLESHLESQNNNKSLVVNALGQKNTRVSTLPFIAGSLPYSVKVTAERYTEIPENFRHKFRYQIFESDRERAMDGAPVLDFQMPTVMLAGKKATIAWVAADEANEQAIEALLPVGKSGQSLKVEDIPSGLPASILLKAQLRIEGEVKAESPAMRTGAEPVGAGGFTRYSNLGQWDETTDQLVVGQQSALGLSIQGISAAQLENLNRRIKNTKSKLESALGGPELWKEIGGEQLTGDALTATLWGYFAAVEANGEVSREAAGMIDLPGMSFGLFHAQAQPNKLWGTIINGVKFKGLNMDIGHLRSIRWSKDNNRNTWILYNRIRGQVASSFEHSTPEQFWIDRSKCRYSDMENQVQNPALAPCVEGVSAVKALAIAVQEGQKIYTLTSRNAHATLSKLNISSSVAAEIRAAIDADKEVTIHERAITAHGWNGFGYLIIDPETGTGAYLIEGKGNGGQLEVINGGLAGLVDALTQKLRNPNSVNGPLDELQRSYWIKHIAFVASAAVFLVGVINILNDDSLSPMQKAKQIAASLTITFVAMEAAAYLGALFMNPAGIVVGAALAVMVGVLLAMFLAYLNREIAEGNI